jgi:hypothetical protein
MKASAWQLEDEAEAMQQKAALLSVTAEQTLLSALSHKSDLPEAHAELASRHRREHRADEAMREPQREQKASLLLEKLTEALPQGHPDRQPHFSYLREDGALT